MISLVRSRRRMLLSLSTLPSQKSYPSICFPFWRFLFCNSIPSCEECLPYYYSNSLLNFLPQVLLLLRLPPSPPPSSLSLQRLQKAEMMVWISLFPGREAGCGVPPLPIYLLCSPFSPEALHIQSFTFRLPPLPFSPPPTISPISYLRRRGCEREDEEGAQVIPGKVFWASAANHLAHWMDDCTRK